MSRHRAVLDLGSNSFHLLTARELAHGWTTDERIKRKVQLMAGFENGHLSAGAIERGLACIGAFAQRLSGLDRTDIKVMGTCALRSASNRGDFVAPAADILGVPVDVISGDEEARLIFTGVAHTLPSQTRPRCVVDIGGGSTEFAVASAPAGQTSAKLATLSVGLGCVAVKDRFFKVGIPVSVGYANAKAEAARLLDATPLPDALRHLDPDAELVGTSGTMESVLTVLDANGWGHGAITGDGLATIEAALTDRRWFAGTGLPGLPPDRIDIFPAGVAIIAAVFNHLGLTQMSFCKASLQDGMLAELIGQPSIGIAQSEITVRQLQERFQVDKEQAARVASTAGELFEATRTAWWGDDAECRALLDWAAALHELGKLVDPRHYHRHGAYVVKSHEMRGFSAEVQRRLALMVRGHRRSFPGLASRAFTPEAGLKLRRLIALLRIAVILNRSRTDADQPQPIAASANGDSLRLELAPEWLASHPLSVDELAVEANQLAGAGLRLTVDSRPVAVDRTH